jgi:hypothetical protein
MSHLVTTVTSLSSIRLILEDTADKFFDVDEKEVVVGGVQRLLLMARSGAGTTG